MTTLDDRSGHGPAARRSVSDAPVSPVSAGPADSSVAVESRDPTRPRSAGWLGQLLRRLHFYAGIFVGPFILLAALSGAAYAAAPSIEKVVYHHQLTTDSVGAARPLSAQVFSAQRYIAENHPADQLVGVKPASAAGTTTQVMFSEAGLREGQVRSVWIDPVTAAPHGDLTVFSTALPISTWIDVFHRTLFLGDVGRAYSELAASWLGIIALAGMALWVMRIRRARRKRELLRPQLPARGYRRAFSWHASTGVWLLLGALFLSATGITWSLHAGANVDALRTAMRQGSPTVSTSTGALPDAATDGTAQRRGRDLAVLDEVMAKARSVNIRSAEVEIDLPAEPGQAWTVSEIKRSYPTAVSSVTIDAHTMRVVSRADFADYPLAGKLAQWGIDTHMGLMFGLVNQIVLFVAALGIAAMVVYGYLMWWLRRPTRGNRRVGNAPSRGALARAPWWGLTIIVALGLGLSLLLPEFGISLLAFVLIDAAITSRRPTTPPRQHAAMVGSGPQREPGPDQS